VTAGLYCVADLGSTLVNKLKNAGPELTTGQKAYRTMAEGIDLSFFHLFATMLIPPQIIGAAADSANRMLDADVLAEAQAHSKPVAAGSSTLQQWLGQVSQKKLALETAVNQKLAPHIDKFLTQRAKSLGEDSAISKGASWLFDTHRAKVQSVVSTTSKITDAYNRCMPVSLFKADELVPMLESNQKALSSPGKLLDSKQLAKLIWTKPIPVLVGVGLIPSIAHAFDAFMVQVQNWTTRLLFGKNKLVQEQGKWISKRNPDFWGKPAKPPVVYMAQSKPHPYPPQPGQHIHQGTAHFGIVPRYPYAGGYLQVARYVYPWQPLPYQPMRTIARPGVVPSFPINKPGYPTGYPRI
jgi:hypothetical protein